VCSAEGRPLPLDARRRADATGRPAQVLRRVRVVTSATGVTGGTPMVPVFAGKPMGPSGIPHTPLRGTPEGTDEPGGRVLAVAWANVSSSPAVRPPAALGAEGGHTTMEVDGS
jgi:hypothetical protein